MAKASEVKQEQLHEQPIEAVQDKFLPEIVRANTIEQLEQMGITNAAGLNDTDLLTKLRQTLAETHETRVRNKAESLEQKLESYAKGTLIKDKKFLMKLLSWNVPRIYLHLFRDIDKEMEHGQIWDRIRMSGINPISTLEVVRERAKYKPSAAAQIKKARLRELMLNSQLTGDLSY